MDNISSWHKLAYLSFCKGLRFDEVVKAVYIFSLAEFITSSRLRGYGILSNQELYESLVLSIILGYPEGERISQAAIAEVTGWSRPTVARTIKSLVANKKLHYERKGAIYEVINADELADWFIEYGKALIELYYSPDMKEALDDKYGEWQFRRGFQVLWDEVWGELRNIRPRRTHDAENYSKDDSTDATQ